MVTGTRLNVTLYVHCLCCWLSEHSGGASTGGILRLQRATWGRNAKVSSTLTEHCSNYD